MFQNPRYCFWLPLLLALQFFLAQFSFSSQNNAELELLAKDPYWQTLLHMEPQTYGPTVSFVDDPKFFLAATGHSDAHAELRATVAQFTADPETRCRFIARWQWLQKKLPSTFESTENVCTDYQKWRDKMNTHKIVLVFASSYLNSPSSMYGHTFLRLDSPNIDKDSPLLSYALNFGATVNESDNGMLYAIRGLVGGYPGQFSAQPYYEKVKEYSRLDNRDLWEYQLNFNAPEIDRMLAHIWELNFINFDYYFFDENCSLRLLELLDIARPGHNLGSQFPIVAVPIDTVRAVQNAGMIDGVHYRASNATRQTLQNTQLSDSGRRLTQQLVVDESALAGEVFLTQPIEQQQRIVEVAYSHLRNQQDKRSIRDKAIAKRRYALLKKRNALSSTKVSGSGRVPVPIAPEDGHETSVWGVRLGSVDGHDFVDIDARIAYHDLLDNQSGYADGSTLAMGRIVLRAEESESLSVEAFELINIMSLSVGDQLSQPLSWQVDSGGRRIRRDDKDSWLTFLNGGAGYTYNLAGSLKGYGLLRAQLEYSDLYQDHWDFAGGVTAGLLLQTPRHNVNFDITHWEFSSSRERQTLNLGYQYALDNNVGLRVEWQHHSEDRERYNEASVGVRYYF